MEVIIALGHFCEIHGPCIILCTDRVKELPEVPPPSLNVPICDACESIDLDTIYTCQDEISYYVSTRTSLYNNTACLMHEAVVRSLSVEVVSEEDKDEGTMYFGDNIKGHFIIHLFTIKDSLSRGFKRKYCIIVRGQHQIPLLHHYDFIENNLKQISGELVQKANQIYEDEKYIRDQQTSQGITRKPVLRSLKDLVGEPYVFSHLHLWFVFLLRAEIYKAVPQEVSECPVACPTAKELRVIHNEMPQDVFRVVLYCILTGIKVDTIYVDLIQHFKQLLPKDFVLPTTGTFCQLNKTDNIWDVQFKGTLPKSLPRMYVLVEEALKNPNLPDPALKYYLMSIAMRWFNIACVIGWSTGPCDQLMRSLGVHKCDMPLLSYWIPQSNSCVKFTEADWFHHDDVKEVPGDT